jgi:hypothetical protein
MELRERRQAENEALFQGLTATIGRFHTDYNSHLLEFRCECSSPGCTAKPRLTQEEYETARGTPSVFLVVPGHEDPTAEQVILRPSRFLVIERKSTAIAEQTDLHR